MRISDETETPAPHSAPCTIGSALFAILAPKVCGIAIVGPTSAGKTTPVNLLMHFYDIQSGHITIDGTDITVMRRNDVRSLMGMVLQDTWLFGGTIRENISYGREHATDTEIQAAAKAARADHFIRTLPQGYDTVLNEETTSLSQGQRHASNASWHAVPRTPTRQNKGLCNTRLQSPLFYRFLLRVQAFVQASISSRPGSAHRVWNAPG